MIASNCTKKTTDMLYLLPTLPFIRFTFTSGVATQTGSNDACSLRQITWSLNEKPEFLPEWKWLENILLQITLLLVDAATSPVIVRICVRWGYKLHCRLSVTFLIKPVITYKHIHMYIIFKNWEQNWWFHKFSYNHYVLHINIVSHFF